MKETIVKKLNNVKGLGVDVKVFVAIMLIMTLIAGLSGCSNTDTTKDKNSDNTQITDGADKNDDTTKDGASGDTVISTDTSLLDSGLNFDTLKYEFNTFIGRRGLYLAYYSSDEDYDVILRNTNHESLVQSSDGSVSVYLNNGKFINFGSNVMYGDDVDILKILELGIESVDKEIGILTCEDVSDMADETTYRFVIDINGYDKIERFYGQENEEYGSVMRNALIESAKNNDKTEEDGLNLRLVYLCNETSGLVSGAYDIYYGSERLGVEEEDWSNIYCMWQFNDYYLLDDWMLDEAWYDFDYSIFSNEHNLSDEEVDNLLKYLTDLAIDLTNELGEMVETFFNENFEVTDEIPSDNTEDTENNDSGTTEDTKDSEDSNDTEESNLEGT